MNFIGLIKRKTIIIAEAGINHNGRIDIAIELIDAAKNAGADVIKFQAFCTDKMVSKFAKKAEYQKVFETSSKTQQEMLKKVELDEKMIRQIKEYCNKKNIIFSSSVFDIGSVDLLEELNIPFYKLGSGEITNIPLLEHVAKKRKPIILSTGMANLSEIEEAIDIIKKNGNSDIILLHCVTQYPAPKDQVNLRAIVTLKEAFKLDIGYSDHTLGFEISVAAVALGAKIVEKHLTLDQNMEGPDHKASMEPDEFKKMVLAIRNVESAMGNGIKEPAPCEKNNIQIVRKSLVYKRDFKAGYILTEDDFEIKRPATGISPKQISKVIGMCLFKDVKADKPLRWEHFKKDY